MKVSPKTPDDADRRIGLRLRDLRLQRGMSQTGLGNAIGVTFQQVQKYEKGLNRVTGARLERVASLFDVPVSFFYGDGSTSDISRLVEMYQSIADPRKREAILTLVQSMVAE
jgi:transcriptional regulator with XRE-family HTH domain